MFDPSAELTEKTRSKRWRWPCFHANTASQCAKMFWRRGGGRGQKGVVISDVISDAALTFR